MKAYLRIEEKKWRLEKDQETILNTDLECIFAEDIDEAIDYINKEMNPHAPDFFIARKVYYHNDKDRFIIMIDPHLIHEISFDKAVEVIKEHGKVLIDGWSELRKLELQGNFNEHGIIRNNISFVYDPEKAKKQVEPTPYGRSRRKNFIRVWEISSLAFALLWEFKSQISKKYFIRNPHVSIFTKEVLYYRRYKVTYCDEIMRLTDAFNTFFGKFSYRKVSEFQNFKKNWKKVKPRSAKQTGVTEEFFGFMQEEIKRRKPRVSSFKPRRITLDIKEQP